MNRVKRPLRRKYSNGRRYSQGAQGKARELRSNGSTHREISQKLGISLGSAHLWTADIKLTSEQKEAIEQRRIDHFRTVRVYTKRERREISERLAPYREKYTKQQLLDLIRIFYRSRGRIPLKREFNMWDEYRRRFRSWNNAIQAAGFRPNEVIFSKRFRAADGHVSDSFAECIIDNWLHRNGIIHEKNFRYPGTRMTADFKVDRVLIEYFGLAGTSKRYNVLIQRKRKLCAREGLVLYEIYPDDLFLKNCRYCLGNILRHLRAHGAI